LIDNDIDDEQDTFDIRIKRSEGDSNELLKSQNDIVKQLKYIEVAMTLNFDKAISQSTLKKMWLEHQASLRIIKDLLIA